MSLIYQAYESLKSSPLDPALRILVELYVSHINGCNYCIELHTREAKEYGILQERLDDLLDWRSTKRYSEAEQAAFEWCETMTRIDLKQDYSGLSAHFSEREIADLSITIALMNTLNRLAIFLR